MLKNEISFQQNPLVLYKQEGHDLFDAMIDKIQETTIGYLYNTQIVAKIQSDAPKELVEKFMKEHPDIVKQFIPAEVVNKTPIEVEKTPHRNELCPCGSGKKYKSCCGKK